MFCRTAVKMLGSKRQSKISAFFKSAGEECSTKRPMSSIENSKDETPNKKAKVVAEDHPKSSSGLSPEQKDSVAGKRKEAKANLESKHVNGNAPEGFGESWATALAPEFEKDYFKKLHAFVAQERSQHTIYPPAHEVFTWTQQCNIRDIKVVILGQDPYHGPGQAHGLCFSVVKGVKPPPSLKNMFKELTQDDDVPGFTHPGHGDLTGWAQQGVLLLNAVLTVKAHQANSHKGKGWETFTDAVISWLNKNLDDVVFMLWGAYAQKKGSVINAKRHHVLKAVHPSPLSAHRGFFGCAHFSKANQMLQSAGKTPIDWTKLD